MKKYLFGVALTFALVLYAFANDATAQSRIVTVVPGLGTLNDAIDGDTTATGERIDPLNTAYQLQGGEFYQLTRTITNQSFPLHIRVNPADSERARLQIFDGGDGASRAFEAFANLKLEGLKVTNADQNGQEQERIVRLRTANIKVTIDNCWLEVDAQTAFRHDATMQSLFIYNSIISNIGRGFDPDNGRMIDDRGDNMDSLVIYNTVAYNITSRFLRDGGGFINYAKVDQCTFVNSAQRGFDFGLAKEVYFTNNLVVNGSFEGTGIPEVPGAGSESFVEVSIWFPDPAAQVLVVSHNNVFTQSALTNLYAPTVQAVPLLRAAVEVFVTEPQLLSTNIVEVIELNDAPAPPVQYLQDFFNGNVANTPKWWDPDFLEYDFTYSTSTASYTGGSEGQNIGVLFGAPACTANGGTLSAGSNRSFCVGTGSPSGINVSVDGASGGLERWGLFDANGNLVANRSGNSLFNLDSYPAGNYTIRYMRYEAGVDISQITSLSSFGSLEGCFGTSANAITVFLREEPFAGTLTSTGPTSICANSGPSSVVQLSLGGFAAENLRYVLVSQTLGNQVVSQNAGTTGGTAFNLNGLPAGTYRAAALGFQAGVNLSGVQFQSQLQGCFDLSNFVTIFITNCLNASMQAQPNPTNGPSYVTFSNPRTEYATLEVYDLSGRMVERIFNQVVDADREYRVQFDAGRLTNGVYLYRLTTANEIVTQKFVVGH